MIIQPGSEIEVRLSSPSIITLTIPPNVMSLIGSHRGVDKVEYILGIHAQGVEAILLVVSYIPSAKVLSIDLGFGEYYVYQRVIYNIYHEEIDPDRGIVLDISLNSSVSVALNSNVLYSIRTGKETGVITKITYDGNVYLNDGSSEKDPRFLTITIEYDTALNRLTRSALSLALPFIIIMRPMVRVISWISEKLSR